MPAPALTDRELRLVFGTIALCDALLAFFFVMLVHEEPLVPWVSPLLFAAGAVGSALVACRPEYRGAFMLSLVGTACAAASRAVYVPAAALTNVRVLTGWRAAVGVVVYTAGTLGITWVWLRFLQPAIELRRGRRRAAGAPRR
jgi:hypothetical protein